MMSTPIALEWDFEQPVGLEQVGVASFLNMDRTKRSETNGITNVQAIQAALAL